MFFIFFFSFFPKKKFLLFFFLYFFQIFFLLLALVSECNCFLRSRCSMEMWCPDDIGRDSWDWVGPPAWVRACFNSPEWGGSSSPVKTEPLQIVLLLLLLLLLLLFWTNFNGMCMASTRSMQPCTEHESTAFQLMESHKNYPRGAKSMTSDTSCNRQPSLGRPRTTSK